MMKNYKFIFCLLMMILASISCAAANEDINGTINNNYDNSIDTHPASINFDDNQKIISSEYIEDIPTTSDNDDSLSYPKNTTNNGDSKILSSSQETYHNNTTFTQISNTSNINTSNQLIKSNHYMGNENNAILYTIDTNGQKSLNDLNTTINNIEDGQILYLNGTNFIYSNDDNSININKNITITGASQTDNDLVSVINGSALATNIFTIKNVNSVILKNILFTNCKGPVITVNNANINIVNCNFTKNNLGDKTQNGGAVHITGDSSANFTSVNFNENSAKYGGAVYIYLSNTNNGNIFNFINCSFINNSASEGGSIYIYGYIPSSYSSIVNCTFINNTVSDGSAGTVYIYSFNTSSYANIVNCTFINNTVRGGSGGAVYIYGFFIYSKIVNCTFINNTVTGSGGAVYIWGYGNSSFNIKNCKFIKNNAYGDVAGALAMFSIDPSSFNIDNCDFSHNSVHDGNGSAIYIWGYNTSYINITNSNLFNNTAHNGSGAIYIWGSCPSSNINNCNFTNNKALNTNGGAIYIIGYGSSYYTVYFNITNSKFTNNSASSNKAGAIYITGEGSSSFNIINSNFTKNTAHDGGAIYITTSRPNSNNIINCNFTSNNANNGGAIYTTNYCSNNLTQCTFNKNTATNGGAIYSIENSINLNQCTFTSNNANNGGAIHLINALSANLHNCNFTSNTANNNIGGAIFIDSGSNNITECKFTENKATYGGAIYTANSSINNISKCNFRSNTAQINGGAIYLTESSLNMTETTITNNNAVNGSAIYNNGNLYLYDNDRISPTTETIYITSTATINSNITIRILNNETKYVYSDKYLITATIFDKNDNSIVLEGLKFNITYNTTEINPTASYNVNIAEYELNLSGINTTYIIQAKTNTRNNLIIEGATLKIVHPRLTITGSIVTYGENSTININITNNGDPINGTVTLEGSEPLELNITNGSIIYNLGQLPPGGHIITVNYYNITNSTIVMVNKRNIVITEDNMTFKDNGDLTSNITINVPTNITGHITITINTTNYTSEIINGSASFIVNGSYSKDVNLSLEYSGDEYTNGLTGNYIFINGIGLELTGNDVDYGEDTIITIELINNNQLLNGTVTISIDDNEPFNLNVDGVREYNLGVLNPGYHNITVKYGSISDTISVFVKSIIDLNITSSNVTYGENTTINVTLTNNGLPFKDIVTIIIDDNKTIKLKINGTIDNYNLGPLSLGSHNITVCYDNIINSTIIFVKRNITDKVTVNIWNNNDNATSTILVKFPKNTTGNVTININGINYTTIIINENALFNNITGQFTENININVNYSGDEYNYEFNKNYTANIYKINITVNNLTMYYKNGSVIIVNITINDNPIANQDINITINGIIYHRSTNINGLSNLTINLRPGNYTATTTYMGPDNEFYIIKSNIEVLSTINGGKDITKYYGNNINYCATFFNLDGAPLANTNIIFNIHGVLYTALTDENATATISIHLLPGEYIITTYNPVNNQSYSNNITVLNTLNTTNIIKYFRNQTQFTSSIVDNNGNIVKDANVIFNINGILYNATTNNKGIATLNINLNPGNYTITTYNSLTGQSTGNTIDVLPVLTGKDLIKTYSENASYTIHLVDGQGRPAAGKNITFNIHGVFYHSITNSKGDASLLIHLLPGKYIITAYSYINDGITSISNTITVK